MTNFMNEKEIYDLKMEATFDDAEDENLWELLEEEYYQWKNGQYSKRKFNSAV